MPSEAYRRFLASMKLGFDQWHDGTGFDLEALARMGLRERADIETLLIEKLKINGDWRDVEGLMALATLSAWCAVKDARFHANANVRNYVLRILLDHPNPEVTNAELEERVIQAVKEGFCELAERLPTPQVKRALLECARNSDGTHRVCAAALLLYLCGQAQEPFDWSQRPFFLRFAEENPTLLQRAWEELRRRTGL